MSTSVKEFSFTGAVQPFVVPTGVTQITCSLWGGASGDLAGALGGEVVGVLNVTPGETLYLYVAGRGKAGGASGAGVGGFNGGGNGASGASNGGGYGGGGATDIRQGGSALGNRKAVAAGGGGANGAGNHNGGNGGGTTGATGVGTNGGHGGSQTAAGTAVGSNPGHVGGLGLGGLGAGNVVLDGGGGGGAGYWGGAGGGTDSGTGGNSSGGGGGSNYVGGFASSTINAQGVTFAGSAGNGHITLVYKSPPNAPPLNAPVNNGFVDQTLPITFDWTFSDPDPGDTQSAADYRWRVGSGAWTVTSGVATTVDAFTTGGGAFTPVSLQPVEWQVRTTDQDGNIGPWSTSFFFTPVPHPTTPVITGSPFIGGYTPSLAWTAADGMVAYEVRSVNDVAGSPGATVLADTGTVPITGLPTGQTATLPVFAYTSGTSYHLQVRYQRYAGVWSTWADSGPLVASTIAPLAPVVTLAASPTTATINVAISNPGGDPAPPDYNDVFRTDLTRSAAEIRVAHLVPLNSTWTDYTPSGNTLYRYRVVAVIAVSGVSSSSA